MNHLIGRIFSRIWMFLRRDFWRKLIALCFAFFTYFAVQAQLAGEQKLTGVPVEIRLPPELISVGRQDFLVSVTARGPKSSLRNFEGRDLKGVVEVRLEEPARAPTPGQLAVFYAEDVVVGSAWIERSGETWN